MNRPKKTMLDIMITDYVEKFQKDRYIEQNELEQIHSSIRQQVLTNALPLIEKEAKKAVDNDVKKYKRQLLKKLRISIIVETIFLAFIVGIIVNQVTIYIPKEFSIFAILFGSLICVLLVILLLIGQEK